MYTIIVTLNGHFPTTQQCKAYIKVPDRMSFIAYFRETYNHEEVAVFGNFSSDFGT